MSLDFQYRSKEQNAARDAAMAINKHSGLWLAGHLCSFVYDDKLKQGRQARRKAHDEGQWQNMVQWGVNALARVKKGGMRCWFPQSATTLPTNRWFSAQDIGDGWRYDRVAEVARARWPGSDHSRMMLFGKSQPMAKDMVERARRSQLTNGSTKLFNIKPGQVAPSPNLSRFLRPALGAGAGGWGRRSPAITPVAVHVQSQRGARAPRNCRIARRCSTPNASVVVD